MFINKIPNLLFSLFILIASLTILYIINVDINKNSPVNSNALKGELNLSAIDFNKDKLVGLSGDYEFYWKQLLSPKDFNDSIKQELTGYIHIPGLWNDYLINNQKLSGNGYATFKLNIDLPTEEFYSIKIKEFDCAYKLWVNDAYIDCGVVGKSKSEEKPSWKRNELRFFAKDKKAKLILQVSNHNHRKGGPEDMMLLGKSDSVISYKNVRIAIAYFLLGLFFIMFIYNIDIYIYRRKEKAYLYFSIICLLIMLRLITTGEKVIYSILPFINWSNIVRIEYLSYTIVIPLFYMFIGCLFPKFFSKTLKNIFNTICLAVVLIILFTPVKIFSYTPMFYQIIAVIVAILILIGLIRAVKARESYSLFMLFGYFLLFVVSINDILYYNKVLSTTFLMPFGLFVIVFVNAFTLSQRYSQSFLIIEALTHELIDTNVTLEKNVELRTQEVIQQKHEIEIQASALQETNRKIIELGKFKDSMTNMIIHDLKNPLNTIINISTMNNFPNKDLIIHEAGRQMDNLVMNILDVNKYENTTMTLDKEFVSIKDLINNAVDDIRFLGKQRDIEFSVNIKNEIKINIDKDIVHRTLVNLLTNAIKFSPIKGHIEITTYIKSPEEISISVKDNGPGIRPEKLKTIFNQYHSESQKGSPLQSTGLGLTFCKLAVESHGGTIEVESENMNGSKFTITLPIS